MPDTFIDIAIWFTIIILTFNVFAMWIDSTTTNPYLKIDSFGNDGLRQFDTSDLDVDTSGDNTISDDASEVSTQRQLNLTGYDGNIVNLLTNLLFMWSKVLNAVIPANAAIIATMMIGIIGIIELVGLLALGMRVAQAIGALLPF